MAHRERRPVAVPLVVGVEVQPDQTRERRVAAKLRLSTAGDPVIGFELSLARGRSLSDVAEMVTARCDVDERFGPDDGRFRVSVADCARCPNAGPNQLALEPALFVRPNPGKITDLAR